VQNFFCRPLRRPPQVRRFSLMHAHRSWSMHDDFLLRIPEPDLPSTYIIAKERTFGTMQIQGFCTTVRMAMPRGNRPSIKLRPKPIRAIPTKCQGRISSPSTSAPGRIALTGIGKVTSSWSHQPWPGCENTARRRVRLRATPLPTQRPRSWRGASPKSTDGSV
jgi:hypothetical protein